MPNKIILILTMSLYVLLAKESYFKIDGMFCENGCSYKIKSVVNAIDGVENSSVDFNKKILFVDYNDQQASDQIIIDKIADQTTFKAVKVEKKEEKKKSWLERLFY